VQLQTVLPPGRLFRLLQVAERRIQRRRRRRNAPRRIDMDYLLHGNARLRHPKLTLPHPRMYRRGFVLLPLADIVGDDFSNIRGAEACINGLSRCYKQDVRRL
jgi:2-amino-4-hydroxy-6-hydroxymethyldihydropteridine diphosphokinase